MDDIPSNVDDNNFGSGIVINEYTSTNMFVCPSDGYIGVLDGGYVYIYGADSTSLQNPFIELSNVSVNQYQYVFVRKGMKAYGSGGTRVFIPLQATP